MSHAPNNSPAPSVGAIPDQPAQQRALALAPGSEIESTLEACREWLAMQTAREGCLTTAGDIIDDLRYHTDSPANFRAAVFPNEKLSDGGPNPSTTPKP